MKIKIEKLVIAVVVTITSLSACKKPLYETEPITQDISYIFDKTDSIGVQAKAFLNDIYANGLPNGYNRISSNVLDAGSDDAISSQPASTIEFFVNGRVSPVTTVDDVWAKSYATIRDANIFLANIDVVPLENQYNLTGTKGYLKAEARLLRAIAYFELIKRYGGVPLIGNKIFGISDNLELPRNTYAECLKYVADECDALKTLSRPESTIIDSDYGKLSQGVAYALKSRLLLYDASPLNNPTGDLAKWVAAAQAAKDLMDLNRYSLVTTPVATGTTAAAYAAVFNSRKNTEVILAYQRGVTFDVETNNSPVGYTATNAAGRGYTSPTQELVDAFPMKNGRAITDAASGYSPAAPYTNRDLRLDYTVFYNGMRWLNRAIETFDGGKDKPGSSVSVQTRTGYYMRKFSNETFNTGTGTAFSNQTHNFPLFRYAEILLNYAEALNESADNAAFRTTALAQLVALRTRAGITNTPAVAGYSYGLKTTMTQVEMRQAIRNERRIEMAFEEQRFWDIRRWKIAETVLNGTLHGMQIVKTGTTTFTYTPYNALNVSFDASKMYRFPISLAEITKNKNLTQNPNW